MNRRNFIALASSFAAMPTLGEITQPKPLWIPDEVVSIVPADTYCTATMSRRKGMGDFAWRYKAKGSTADTYIHTHVMDNVSPEKVLFVVDGGYPQSEEIFNSLNKDKRKVILDQDSAESLSRNIRWLNRAIESREVAMDKIRRDESVFTPEFRKLFDRALSLAYVNIKYMHPYHQRYFAKIS